MSLLSLRYQFPKVSYHLEGAPPILVVLELGVKRFQTDTIRQSSPCLCLSSLFPFLLHRQAMQLLPPFLRYSDAMTGSTLHV